VLALSLTGLLDIGEMHSSYFWVLCFVLEDPDLQLFYLVWVGGPHVTVSRSVFALYCIPFPCQSKNRSARFVYQVFVSSRLSRFSEHKQHNEQKTRSAILP
jgi:hypothetical protein